MNMLNRSLGAWFTATLLAASAQAQPDAGPPSALEPPVVPLYQIEVIVFAYEDADPTEERFRVRAASDTALSAQAADDLAEFDFESAASDLSTAAIEPETDEEGVGGEAALDAAANARSGQVGAEGNLEGDVGATGVPNGNDGGVGAGAVADEDALRGTQPNEALAQSPTPGFTRDGFPDEPGWISRPSRPGRPAFKFRILAPDELQLGDEYARLQRIDAYTPLLHGGWIQQAQSAADAQPFDLTYLGTLNPMGTVQLHSNRFLRLTLDLAYRPSPLQNARLSSVESLGLSELALAPRLPLAADRNVRSRELHYFDHPYFGVLVMVTPYEPEAAPLPGEVGPAA